MNTPADRRLVEERLTRALTETADRAVRDGEQPPVLPDRHRSPTRPARWFPALLAAAAAVIVIAAGTWLASMVGRPGKAAAPLRTISHAPTASKPAPSTGHSSSSRPSSPSSSTPSSSSSAHESSAPCLTSQLSLTPGTRVGAAGQSVTTYYLANLGMNTCTLTGYPGVAELDEHGVVVQHPAVREPGPGTTAAVPVTTVRLDAGGRAQFLVASTDNVPNPHCATLFTGRQLQVYPPNQSTPLLIPGVSSFCDLVVGPVQAATPAVACLTAAQAFAIVSAQSTNSALDSEHGFLCVDGWAYVNFHSLNNGNHSTVDLHYLNGTWAAANRLVACGDATHAPLVPTAIYEYGCGN